MREFENLYEELGRLVQSVFAEPEGVAWVPLADVTETDDTYEIDIELPGVKREDIDVEMIGGELVVRGQTRAGEKGGMLRRRTRRLGDFEFRTTLPGEPEPDRIEANLSDGVLTVRVPKSQRSRRRKVEISQQ
jgi:HSP20 family protein